jgi:hypothetical protein
MPGCAQRYPPLGFVRQYLVEPIPTNGRQCFRTAWHCEAMRRCAVAPRFENPEDFEIAAQTPPR